MFPNHKVNNHKQHITLVPPPALPDEDDFVEKILEVCKTVEPFDIRLNTPDRFGNRVLYISVDSPGLIDLHNKLHANLGLQQERRGFTPHLTIVKQRPKRPVDMAAVRKRAEMKLPPALEYTLNSITVYHQPKEHSIYVPYMEIPLGE